MFKKYKKQLILSSIVILLPIVLGLILWNQLPDSFATHWGVDGQADGWMDKGLAVFLLPMLMLGMHYFCVWITDLTNRGNDQSPKVMNMIFCIMPILSLLTNGMVYAIALGMTWEFTSLFPIFMGLLLVLIGNYMPKCTRNSTVGIKVKWTLANDENWNATHRFAGKTWVAAGLISIFSVLLPTKIGYPVMMISTFLAVFGTMLYSYLYYRRQLKDGTAAAGKEITIDETTKKVARAGRIIGIALLIFCGYIMFAGSIEYDFQESALVMDATFYSPITLQYEKIEAIEYREGNVDGVRTSGFGSRKLLLGFFENEEFGTYSRYTYFRPESCVIVTYQGKTLVLSGETTEETQSLYQEILHRIG